MQWGYTMMGEQSAPRDLVSDVVAAEQAGFDFAVASDHYFPWLDEMGHSPYVWSVLGAAAWATERIPLMTYVTCPTFRYHPAVVAQKAATIQLLSEGRFTLGLGAGENLNEHVVGMAWPPVDIRHERLVEAVQIIRELFDGGYVNHRGEHFQVESAKLWDRPDSPPPIGIAVSGKQSCEIAGRYDAPLLDIYPLEICGDPTMWSHDRIHGSADGHRRIGEAMAELIRTVELAIESINRSPPTPQKIEPGIDEDGLGDAMALIMAP